MANGANADVHKIFATQARQDRFVNFVFAKCRGIPLEAEALQPLCGIHGVARVCLLEPTSTTCSARRKSRHYSKGIEASSPKSNWRSWRFASAFSCQP